MGKMGAGEVGKGEHNVEILDLGNNLVHCLVVLLKYGVNDYLLYPIYVASEGIIEVGHNGAFRIHVS